MNIKHFTSFWLPIIIAIFLAIVQVYTNEIKDTINMIHISDQVQLDLAAVGMVLFVLGRFSVLKSKLIALKDFRDKEIVRITDHFNAQIQTFEDRMKELQEALNEKGIEVNLTRINKTSDPNAELNQARYNDALNAQMSAYNKAFEDWGVGDYGIANKTHLQPKPSK